MAELTADLDERAVRFSALTHAAFQFLEQEYGYRPAGAHVHDVAMWRDAGMRVRYVGQRIGVGIEWAYADAYITVFFVALATAWG